ncbi:MAG: TIGR04255 family protein [Dehalococcoidia bacterium]|nr:TIGR04255 family protein [Dehalococcoidia bacterium]
MMFPEAPRVIYKKNPLDRVICQLRFPPILRIDTEVPAQFQERIRKDFPDFCEKEELILPQKIRQEFPAELLGKIMPSGTKNYEFSSEDAIWMVNLTRTFVALGTTKYRRWEEFKERLDKPLNALIEIYEPAHFSRIGLRYIDIIKRSELGLDGVDWQELLQPYILGLLSLTTINKQVQTLKAKYEISLDNEGGIARIVTGLVEQDKEVCFLIDTDFYDTRKTDTSKVVNKLENFHVLASRLIQWLITQRLQRAMEPETL